MILCETKCDIFCIKLLLKIYMTPYVQCFFPMEETYVFIYNFPLISGKILPDVKTEKVLQMCLRSDPMSQLRLTLAAGNCVLVKKPFMVDKDLILNEYRLGLVAVLLYHDGRRCLLSALRTLLQSREGLTWTLELDEEISQIIMPFTKQMIDEGESLFLSCLEDIIVFFIVLIN